MHYTISFIIALMVSTLLQAGYPTAAVFSATGPIVGFSAAGDFRTGNFHCAYIDMTSDQVIYKLVKPDGTVQATIVDEQVALTQELDLRFACTSIAFDASSRPVVAFTQFNGVQRSIQVARWNGAAWSQSQVAGGGVISTKLSLALYNEIPTAWRLAYVNFTAPSLQMASAGGVNFKVADLNFPPLTPGLNLYYSANSGSLAFQGLASGGLKFSNLSDDGMNASSIINLQTIDATSGVGADVSYAAGPGGWPHFVYLDQVSGAVKIVRRLPDFSWRSENVITRPSPTAVLANPTLAFNNGGNPMIACTSAGGNSLRIAAQVAGTWYHDVIDEVDDFRKPLFLSPQTTGAVGLFAVGDNFNNTSSKLSYYGPIDDFVDADGDGVPLRMERAFVMNPAVADREKLPSASIVVRNGQPRLVLNMRLQPGGMATGGHLYETADYLVKVEASSNLVTWNSNSSRIGLDDVFTLNGVRFFSPYALDPVGSSGGTRFFRVGVDRK